MQGDVDTFAEIIGLLGEYEGTDGSATSLPRRMQPTHAL